MAGLREEKKEQKKETILKESITLFIEKGFEQTSIDDITRRANVAKGSFYSFFEKKEDVLLYHIDRELVKSRHDIQVKMGRAENTIEKLEILILSYLNNIFKNKDFARILVKERVGRLGTGKNWNELILMQHIKHILEEAQERGEIKKGVDVENGSHMVFGIFTMYTIYWLNGIIKTKATCVESIKGVLRMLFEGIGEKNRE